jgi:tetratricopeptide (TPR) repeat protein
MTDFIKEIHALTLSYDLEKIEQLIESRLELEPYNCDLLLMLAILELAPPISDYYKSIDSIRKVLTIKKSDVIASLLLAYVNHYYLGGIDDESLNYIKTAVPDNAEHSSMLKYAESWYYVGLDRKMQETCLGDSIEAFDRHVWNNYYLAKLYLEQGDEAKAKLLLKKAVENVVTVYSDESNGFDILSVDEFVNERIKGICLTKENYELIKQ